MRDVRVRIFGVLSAGFRKKNKPFWLLFLGFIFAGLHSAHADHLVKFEIKELEWNGTLKKYGKPRYVDVEFRNQSRPVFVDSFSGKVLFFRCIYKPVFSDNGEYPAFYGIIFDSAHKGSSITSKSVYEEKMIDASAKEKDKEGLRRWSGKLRFFPDTSIHVTRPAWRTEHFTFMMGGFQCWRNPDGNKKQLRGKYLKKMYFEGYTGTACEPKKAGKYGYEKLQLVINPVRFVWDDQVWIEFQVRLVSVTPDGKSKILIEYTLDSRDPKMAYGEDMKEQPYEICTPGKKDCMFFTKVYVIPY